MKRAYVYFWDGFRFGCRIDTADTDLEERLADAITNAVIKGEKLPGQVTAFFVAMDIARDLPVSVEPPAPARTTAQYVAAAEAKEHWPLKSYAGSVGELQAGVFVVNTLTAEVRIVGGTGFEENVADCNPAQLREVKLALPFEEEGK